MSNTSPLEGPMTRVIFELEVDEDGWPPVSAERMWALDLGNGRYRVENVPWFVRNLAVGDEVLATAADAESYPIFVDLLVPSDHVTVRIICFRSGPLAGDLQRVVDIFTPLGIYAEGVQQYGMVALDIAANTDLKAIVTRLRSGEVDGSWAWEEGRITRAGESAAGD